MEGIQATPLRDTFGAETFYKPGAMHNHYPFMQRCFALACHGAGHVSPNPLVGAVLVHEGRIIGEGWHRKYGEAHAEINALASVKPKDRSLIPFSTLYCNLEPCFHHGRTPPCVDAVLREKIKTVVIANTDPNPLVAGQSVAKMRAAGIEVVTSVLEKEGMWLNRVFFHWISQKRPYVVLKWAQSRDGFLGRVGERTPISAPASQRLVHRWRSVLDAILVGSTTAMVDNPRLDTRFWPEGRAPMRLFYDRNGLVPLSHHLLDDSVETRVLGASRQGHFSKTAFWEISSLENLLEHLAAEKRTSLLVEGGAKTLLQWLDSGFWDEIRIVENEQRLGSGVRAPVLPSNLEDVDRFTIGNDSVTTFKKSV